MMGQPRELSLYRDAAVALDYDGRGAPRVVASARGEQARKILEAAAAHGIPIREDPALLAMLATIEIGEEIPAELYLAVAEVFAFIYTLRDEPLA